MLKIRKSLLSYLIDRNSSVDEPKKWGLIDLITVPSFIFFGICYTIKDRYQMHERRKKNPHLRYSKSNR